MKGIHQKSTKSKYNCGLDCSKFVLWLLLSTISFGCYLYRSPQRITWRFACLVWRWLLLWNDDALHDSTLFIYAAWGPLEDHFKKSQPLLLFRCLLRNYIQFFWSYLCQIFFFFLSIHDTLKWTNWFRGLQKYNYYGQTVPHSCCQTTWMLFMLNDTIQL